MQVEEIAKKILRQTEDTLSVLFEKRVVINCNIDLCDNDKKQAVYAAIEKVTGYGRFDYKQGKGNADESASKHLLMYYMHSYANASIRQIAKKMNVDRGTVIGGISRIRGFIHVGDSKIIAFTNQIDKILHS